ncbi:MAG: hypothetical protein LC796_06100 [Acidobacteria bacterium]|nr:hypothetical protein [Acidobacteriota bacterium]MCA1611081.1 hypothetical protein [Acidobacteriota bacterium]
MPDPPPQPDSKGNDGISRREFDLVSTPGTPRWVYVFGLIAIVLVLLFVILHLTGGGFRGHMP